MKVGDKILVSGEAGITYIAEIISVSSPAVVAGIRPKLELNFDLPIGPQIKTLREATTATQRQIAQKAGLTEAALCRLERGGTKKPHANNLKLILNAIGDFPKR